MLFFILWGDFDGNLLLNNNFLMTILFYAIKNIGKLLAVLFVSYRCFIVLNEPGLKEFERACCCIESDFVVTAQLKEGTWNILGINA